MAKRSESPYRSAWRKFKRNPMALAAAGWIALCILLGVFAYLIIPDKTTSANQQIVELKLRKPGFKTQLFKLPLSSNVEPQSALRELLMGRTPRHRLIPILGIELKDDEVHIKHFMGGDSSVLHERYPLDILVDSRSLQSSDHLPRQLMEEATTSRKFLFGTDALGRDYLSRLILGTRVSLTVGIIGVLISMFIGLALGLIAGWYRGWLDDFIMYVVNVFWAIPTLLLALCLSLVMGNGLWQVFLAIGLTMWVEVARIVRGQVLLTRELPFVQASRAIGVKQSVIILKHILPNIMGPVLVVMAANFAAAILLEAGLSFLGLGVSSPTPSWGMMLSENRNYLVAGLPHLAILPGVAISLLVLSFFVISNALRDAFDIKSK